MSLIRAEFALQQSHGMREHYEVSESKDKTAAGVRILVFLLGSIGDSVVSIPAIRAIRRHFGEAAVIDVLNDHNPSVKKAPGDVFGAKRMIQGYVQYKYADGFFPKVASAFSLWRALRSNAYDVVVYLAPGERTRRQAMRDSLFFRICGIKSRIGFFETSPAKLPAVSSDGILPEVAHESAKRLDRLRASDIGFSTEEVYAIPLIDLAPDLVAEAQKWLQQERLRPERPLVALCPYPKQPAKAWRFDAWMDLGHKLMKDREFELVLIGGREDSDMAGRLLRHWGGGLDATGRFTVQGSAALMQLCTVVIGVDSGPIHLAAAVGTRVIGLFSGVENPGRWEPLGNGHVFLRHAVTCAGCRLIMTPCPVSGHPCLESITPAQVLNALDRLLNKEQSSETEIVYV